MVGLIESLLTLPLINDMTDSTGDNQREVQGLANIDRLLWWTGWLCDDWPSRHQRQIWREKTAVDFNSRSCVTANDCGVKRHYDSNSNSRVNWDYDYRRF